MPTAAAYRRAPLMDIALVPLSDAAVHAEGLTKTLIDRALEQVDLTRMTELDAVLATKLGGYTEAPPMPDVDAACAHLPLEPAKFLSTIRAATLLATMTRDKPAMLRVLAAMQAFLDALSAMPEATLFSVGADALRITVDLYRRTGQRFLLTLMEKLRAQLPDVSGVMHMFPFQRDFEPRAAAATREEQEYNERMERFATGKLTADALAMTAFLAQFSGSGRDAAAPLTGMKALMRFHGMPCGAFSADPYLAGRDPARAVELSALCAQAEAYADALSLTGNVIFAEKLESLLRNALPDVLTENGVRGLSPTNRLADDESCAVQKPEPEDVSALLRGLYAIRRSLWMSKDDETVAYLLPVAGGCLTRLGGVPIRLLATTSGSVDREVRIRVESKGGAHGTLLLHVPAYADSAEVSVNGGRASTAAAGELYPVSRTFQTGDEIVLRMVCRPRVEVGYRGSVSISVAGTLMALALPGTQVAWRYAAVTAAPMTAVEEAGEPNVLIAACEAPTWKEKAGFILPPPPAVPIGAAYELTLIPCAGTGGRIAAFPCATA